MIAIDNCLSRCITNNPRDFVGDMIEVNIPVRGIGGTVMATFKGTVEWRIEDDQGRVHAFRIPDTYLNVESPYRLLSPQHWAQTQKDHLPNPRGTWCGTYHNAVELFWAQNRF